MAQLGEQKSIVGQDPFNFFTKLSQVTFAIVQMIQTF